MCVNVFQNRERIVTAYGFRSWHNGLESNGSTGQLKNKVGPRNQYRTTFRITNQERTTTIRFATHIDQTGEM